MIKLKINTNLKFIVKIYTEEYHIKNENHLLGSPALFPRVIHCLFHFLFIFLYICKPHKAIHTPKHKHTHTHIHTMDYMLYIFLLTSFVHWEIISWSFFLINYIYSSFCIINLYYHNSFRQMPLGIKHCILVWESPRKCNIWCSSPWDIFFRSTSYRIVA